MDISPTKRNYMLSGMNTKDRTDLDKSIAAYLAKGGKITKLDSKSGRRHYSRTKSYGWYTTMILANGSIRQEV